MPTCYRHPDRETGLSCSVCERPVCTECATFAPVGIRCPEHSGRPAGIGRMTTPVRKLAYDPSTVAVTKALIAVNVGIYVLELVGGASLNANQGWIFEHFALYGPLVDNGDWWRLFTAMFLHYGPFHLGMNMLALWWFGGPLEQALGPFRYLALYVAAGLAGSAGALVDKPLAVTVGASGAIFGILGAAFVLERQRHLVFGGGALTLIVINLVFTFAVPNIAIGGHLGGLIGGAAAMAAMYQFRRQTVVGLLAVAGIAALSVVVAYAKVRGLAP